MSSNAEKAFELLKGFIGKEEGVGEWHTVDQKQINLFADATLDHQFIHVDPEAAKATPWGKPIAHGFLTLSMLTSLCISIPPVSNDMFHGLMMGINYGLDKVRFPTPVKVDSKIRARSVITNVEFKAPNSVQLTRTVTIEIDGEPKPGCVAEWLTRLMYT
jgi:acyl dehydratase